MVLVAACHAAPLASRAAEVPQSVSELWSDFDPRKEDLQVELVREWKADGMVLRSVRFLVGTFKGRPARLAAFYGFPEDTVDKRPAVMHIHGGGQRASISEVKMLVARGYAALSVNWGGREMEEAQPGDLNTDWGAVDPTQTNVPGYQSMLPGPKQMYEDREHPKNCNWYLLTLGCRRGLTFLERQPEVDAERLGIHGYSMGGNLTMYVAGTDARVKAAVPGVGGQGWRWESHAFIGGNAVHHEVKGNMDVFRRTLSFESYAPLIRCPVMHRSATNDFHGWMDDTYRTDALITGQEVRHSWTPHMNHRLSPEVAVTMPLWLDHYLQGRAPLPPTPACEVLRKTEDGSTRIRVMPGGALPVARCDIYYSIDPDPRARFWRSLEAVRVDNAFVAPLPLHLLSTPVFVFANVYHTLPKPEMMEHLPGYGAPVSEVCLSTDLLHLQGNGAQGAEPQELLIDDFKHGWRDWYQLNAGNRDHWQNWTRKITDPKWRGPEGAALLITCKVEKSNRIAIVVIENEWRSYRGRRKTFLCSKDIVGSDAEQTLKLTTADFKNVDDGTPLTTWAQLDQLGFCAWFNPKATAQDAPVWNGSIPQFLRVEWQR